MAANFPIDESALLGMGMPRHVVTALRENHNTASTANTTANTATVSAATAQTTANTATATINTHIAKTNLDAHGDTATGVVNLVGATFADSTNIALGAVSGSMLGVVTTGSTQATPYGYTTAAQADAIVTQINALVADMLNVKQVLTALLTDVKTIGVTG
ncbi:MAG: hypothetical protein B7Z60_10170 [Ferrovum sp. 37-45-19]|nr:MAG: hypothetical protein B7Z60_10170 [Ferrovum sp. 37-45-19]